MSWFFILLLLISLISQNTKLPPEGAYVATTLTYLFGIFLFITNGERSISAKRWSFVLISAFTVVVFLNTLVYPSTFNSTRLVVLITFTLLNFYLISSVINLSQFLYAVSRVGALLTVIGVLPLIGFPTQIGFIDISLWGFFSDLNIPIITSVFVNPNQLGFFMFVGTVGALREQSISDSRFSTVILGTNALGLMLSHYRGGWTALLAALGLWYVYHLFGRKSLILITISGITTIAVGLSLLFGIIPGPQILTEISLNGRRELWIASIHALQNNLLAGQGLAGTAEIVGNPHNSYLRMFASFGIIGGLIYTFLVVGVTIESTREAISIEALLLTTLLMGMLLIQIFNQLSFVGISMRSTIIAIFMGYHMSK
ncbi:O-antigen ligase family protein [Halorhabdus tiamatea]|uniref:O-antigen ligase-like membrane protein n=2 Tax=Halorhabdus tiamatea SARL4B TaxID=1033806 RepID=S6D2D1_9EURY|nr:O-antigen ligase family protein [Halorhabdus tiamatea]CCQ33130.1 O-antigen ligase-like membrane protein [Halorhabdus tiamatea SARL4B]